MPETPTPSQTAADAAGVATPGGPLLLMGQAGEYDRANAEPVFRAIFASLVIDAD